MLRQRSHSRLRLSSHTRTTEEETVSRIRRLGHPDWEPHPHQDGSFALTRLDANGPRNLRENAIRVETIDEVANLLMTGQYALRMSPSGNRSWVSLIYPSGLEIDGNSVSVRSDGRTADSMKQTGCVQEQVCEVKAMTDLDRDGDTELEAVDGAEDAPLAIDTIDRRVKSDKQDIPIETIRTWVQRGRLDLQPDFQRHFVWNRAKASRLIESVLLEIPIPVVYVAETHDRKLEVVDGQQRVTSLCAFCDGRFPDGSPFRLSGLQVLSELNGTTFQDLDEAQQEAILACIIRMIVLSRDSDPDVKFEVFERLNLGSVRLNNQELRNCIYRGALNDLIKDLSLNSFLLRIRRVEAPHERMEDRHLVLRFLAMRERSHLNYRSPMKQFLNRFMEDHRYAQAETLLEWRQMFEAAIESAWHVFGEHAFRRVDPSHAAADSVRWSGPINVALWDTVLYGLSFYSKPQIIRRGDQIREEFIDLMFSDEQFRDCTRVQTDNVDRLQYRADVWCGRLRTLFGTAVVAEPRTFSYELKAEMFNANPTCRICQQRLQHIDDAELDHVEHYWRGGLTIPENARLVHRFCNRSRGGRSD